MSKSAIEGRDVWYRIIDKIGKWELLAWSIAWEGSISLGKSHRKKGGFYLCPMIMVVNSNLELLRRLADIIEFGNIYQQRRRKLTISKFFRRPMHQWHVHKLGHLAIILKEIIPLLPSKEKQSKLLLEYVQLRMKHKGHGRNAPYGKRELEIYEEMKILNRRGVEC